MWLSKSRICKPSTRRCVLLLPTDRDEGAGTNPGEEVCPAARVVVAGDSLPRGTRFLMMERPDVMAVAQQDILPDFVLVRLPKPKLREKLRREPEATLCRTGTPSKGSMSPGWNHHYQEYPRNTPSRSSRETFRGSWPRLEALCSHTRAPQALLSRC